MSGDLARLRFISDQPAWYGARSGYYAQLPNAFAALGYDTHVTAPSSGLAWRAAGKAWSLMWGLPRRQQTLTADELRFHVGWIADRHATAVILSLEQHLPALTYWHRAPRRLIGTLHLPRPLWTDDGVRALRRLQSAVVLYRADLDYFASAIGTDRVRFVPHGVDTEFFAPPAPGARPDGLPPLLLCVGQFGRDFRQLQRVAPRVLEKVRDAELRIVLAPHADDAALLPTLRCHPRVRIVRRLPDAELLRLYQRAMMMLLPMEAAAASNAVVEALACGLPIVSTDVGGMRDYGGGTHFPILTPGDDDAFVGTAVRLAHDQPARQRMAIAMRQFAVTHLHWAKVAAEHSRVYQELAA